MHDACMPAGPPPPFASRLPARSGASRYVCARCGTPGWLNLLGQFASLASTHYFMAYIICTIVLLATGTATPPPEVRSGRTRCQAVCATG